MPSPNKTPAPAKSRAKTPLTDAIELLIADHKSVKALFQTFKKIQDREGAEDEKADVVQRICSELTVHATIEEEVFYPAVRQAIDDQDLMDEADVEHASAKDLINQLESASPGDDHYDAKVTVLSEMIDHHVKEEESEMFPKARKAIDVDEVGAELAARKAELAGDLAHDPPIAAAKKKALAVRAPRST